MLSIAPRPHENQYSIARRGPKRKKNIGEIAGEAAAQSGEEKRRCDLRGFLVKESTFLRWTARGFLGIL